MELKIIFLGKSTTKIPAIPKTHVKSTANITMNVLVLVHLQNIMQTQLTHYECQFLCMEHGCPYDRQSGHSNLSVTRTSYIWVTQNEYIYVEPVSPYEGHTSHPHT